MEKALPHPTSETSPTATVSTWSPRLWGILLVCCSALFIDALDVSMVSVALPSIGADLGLSTTELQWIMTGYVLTFGALLLLGGRVADLFGRRKVLLFALAGFAAASFMGAVVDSGVLLILSRVLKGIAAACTAPAAMSIVTTTFREGRDRNKALGIFAIFGASGYSFGLVVSGLLTEMGWRWTFLMPVPVALTVLIVGYFLIPTHRPQRQSGFDVLGAVTLTSGLLLGVYGIVTLAEDQNTIYSLGAIVAALVLIASFIKVETTSRHPLIRLGIFRQSTLVRANVIKVVLLGSFLSFQFVMTLYLQNSLEWSPMHMALALAPTGVLVMAISPFVGRLIGRFGALKLIMVSLSCLSAAYVTFLFLANTSEPSYAVHILPSVVLLGLGFAFGVAPTVSQGTSGVDDAEQGLAAGLLNTSGQVGGAVVLAGVTALIASGTDTTGAEDGITPFLPGLYLTTAVVLAGLVIASKPMWTLGKSRPPLRRE